MECDWVMSALLRLPLSLAAQFAWFTGTISLEGSQMNLGLYAGLSRNFQPQDAVTTKGYDKYQFLLDCYTSIMHAASHRGTGHVRQAGGDLHWQPMLWTEATDEAAFPPVTQAGGVETKFNFPKTFS